MDKRSEEAITRLVADWPELTGETKARLREVLVDQPDAQQDWIKRQLEKMPERSQEWKAETLRLWGLKPGNLDEPS